MKSKFVVVFAVLAAPVTSGAANAKCLGVAVQTADGEANLVMLTVNGTPGSFGEIELQATLISADIKDNPADPTEVVIGFNSDVKSSDASTLVQNAKSGLFGPLKARTTTLPISTLPADKCPRK